MTVQRGRDKPRGFAVLIERNRSVLRSLPRPWLRALPNLSKPGRAGRRARAIVARLGQKYGWAPRG